MSRFDEFSESLKYADACLEQVLSCLNANDFDSEEDRYIEVHDLLSDARYELEGALQDVSDNVGILCDTERLRLCIAECEALKQRVWSEIKSYDWTNLSFYRRLIRSIQYDIEQIAQGAR